MIRLSCMLFLTSSRHVLTSSLHQIEALVKVSPSFKISIKANVQAGVKDIVLAVNYRPEVMVSVLKKTEEELGSSITFSVETEPLGTGELNSTATREE